MNIITQNLKTNSGTVTLDGVPIDHMGADYRSLLGYMPQQQTLYDDFTGERFLWYMAALKGLDKSRQRRPSAGPLTWSISGRSGIKS